jgi:hypothetical protein
MRWAGYVARIGGMRNIYKHISEKSEGKRPFEGPRRRWKDNSNNDLGQIKCEVMGWIQFCSELDKNNNELLSSIKAKNFLTS